MLPTNPDLLIELAVNEDFGDGDHSSFACIPTDAQGVAQLLIKDEGVLAGIEISQKVIAKIDTNLTVDIFLNDGARIKPGDMAFSLSGKVHSILQAERLILNFMQRMSGIATETAKYADLISDLKTKVLDTRKTTPGLRYFEKMAVRIGGGTNHRMGLYDMVMLKDNHIDYAGGIENAILKTNHYLKINNKSLPIIIEVRNFEELEAVLKTGQIQRILLDNFSVDDTRKAVQMISGRFETESSGGINLETIRNYALCGVDFVSIGALTHGFKSLDMSLKAVLQ
jgi:nicotinate-nucleotide pyrophosphorylase (carboxylating)